jgi:hypothetical protein
MVIALLDLEGSSLQRSEMHGSTYSSTSTLRFAGAPNRVGREVYKHLAPLEPEIIGCDLAALIFRSGLFIAGSTTETSNRLLTYCATKL